MGIVPLEYLDGESAESLGLTGRERYDVEGIAGGVTPQQEMTVRVVLDAGDERTFTVRCRIDTPLEAEYYRHGGILQYVLRQLAED
jgi:aconitate hydratase